MWFGAFPGKGFSGFVSGTETAMDRNLKNEMGFNEIEAGQIRNAGTRMGLEHALIRRPGQNYYALMESQDLLRNAPGYIDRVRQGEMMRNIGVQEEIRSRFPYLEMLMYPYPGIWPGGADYSQLPYQPPTGLPSPDPPRNPSEGGSAPTPIDLWHDINPYGIPYPSPSPSWDPYPELGPWGSYGQGRGNYQPPRNAVPTYQDPLTGAWQVGDPYTDPYNAYPYPFYGRYR